jgi:hypothetical protein
MMETMALGPGKDRVVLAIYINSHHMRAGEPRRAMEAEP